MRGWRGLLAVCVTAITLSAGGCRNLDVLTETYATLAEAQAAGAVDRGWLPRGLPPGTRELRLAHDVDSTRRWGLFNFPPEEGDALRALAGPEISLDGLACNPPGRIEWWPVLLRQQLNGERIKATGLRGYAAKEGDLVLAVNWAQGRAYYWTGSSDSGLAIEFGAEDWNRTSDTSIFSAVLYQLSYLGTA